MDDINFKKCSGWVIKSDNLGLHWGFDVTITFASMSIRGIYHTLSRLTELCYSLIFYMLTHCNFLNRYCTWEFSSNGCNVSFGNRGWIYLERNHWSHIWKKDTRGMWINDQLKWMISYLKHTHSRHTNVSNFKVRHVLPPTLSNM